MELGWIDFSKTERSKILSVLDLLSESGTLDELGIAPVRDGFSNLFFPGTTTIQTRAKYFFIVPYALKQLERSSETNPNRVFKALDAIEKTCGQTFLEQNSNENGIIGKRSLQSGGWVKRTPADIYWAGLKRYGIFTGGSLSLSEYIRISCAMKDKKTTLKKLGNRNDNAEENECDDKNAGDLFKMQFWKMPLYSDKWMENLSINLAKAEAEFLQEQIIENCKGSLLACVLEMGITEFLDCESFRDLGAIIDKFPEAVQQDYWLALAFSDFIYVIRTVYNIIISYGQNEAANDELERLKPELKELADIDVDFILNKLEVFTNPLLKKFLKQSQDLMIAGDIEGLKKCITNREVQLKGTNRAKTTHPGEFDVNEWIGGGELDYRFFNARTIVRDPSYISLCYKEWLRTQYEQFPLNEEYSYTWLINVPELFARRAPGNTCISAIENGANGTLEEPINRSKGCGGIMRVAPIGLYFEGKRYSVSEIDKIGAETAALTHGHELGYIPAAALVHILHILSHNEDVKMLDAVLDMKKAVRREFVNVKHLSEQIALIDKAIDLANEDVDDLEAIRELGQGWVAEETLAIAIYCALKYSNDFDKALIASVNHSGDSDSTGAVTGNILGAYLGLSGIPEKYLKNLELKNVILELADDLFNDCKITEYGSYHDEIWEQKYIYKSYRPKR